MRHVVALSLLIFGFGSAALAGDETASPAKETVEFDGQTLELAFTGDDVEATIKEFVPQGERLDSWTKLAAIREFENLDNPVEYGIATIEQLKKQYPKSPSAIKEDPNTGAVILDFVVWPEDASFVEFNVFRLEKRSGGGLTSQQYAVRAYGDAGESFLKDLAPVRERLVDEMANKGLQFEATTSADESETP